MPSQSNLDQMDPVTAAADALYGARAKRRSIQQVSKTFAISGLDMAYQVASKNTQRRLSKGARSTGKKIGLTSRVVQEQLGVSQPDFGILFEDMEFLSGSEIPFDQLIQPKAEAEVALVLGSDLTVESPSYGEFLATVAYVLPALEIVDSAIENWEITLEDTVADNASCGFYVLGEQPASLVQHDLAMVSMQMSQNGEVVSTGKGSACMGHPLRAAYWLAKTMAAQGDVLRAGEVILTGALGPMVQVEKGDSLAMTVGALGSVHCDFV